MEKSVHVVVVAADKAPGVPGGCFEPLCELPRLEWTLQAVVRLRPASVSVWLPEGLLPPVGGMGGRCRWLSGAEAERPVTDLLPFGSEGRSGEEVLILSADRPLLTYDAISDLLARHRQSGAGATWWLCAGLEPGAGDRAAAGVVEGEALPPSWKMPAARAGVPWPGLAGLRRAVGAAWFQVEEQPAEWLAELRPVHSRADLVAAEGILEERIVRHWLRAGVHIRRPDRVWIGPRVVLDPSSRLWWDVTLVGETVVAAEADLLPGTFLENARLGPGVRVEQAVIRDSEIRARTTVGPFAHIRGGAVVGPDNRIGNFVEIKKSSTGEGTKASHLAYLGDATIGARVNIGAGTITCNYDGVHKNPTVIGDGAFIGSDSILVAPLRVGEGAYVGAGSTITTDVPPDSLGVARARQRNIDGWARKRREKMRLP